MFNKGSDDFKNIESKTRRRCIRRIKNEVKALRKKEDE